MTVYVISCWICWRHCEALKPLGGYGRIEQCVDQEKSKEMGRDFSSHLKSSQVIQGQTKAITRITREDIAYALVLRMLKRYSGSLDSDIL